MKVLQFFRNANNKLGNNAFSVLRPADGGYKVGEHVHVSLAEGQNVSSFGVHRIEYIQDMDLHQIDDVDARLESGMNATDLIASLKVRYKGVTEFEYMILVKIQQPQEKNNDECNESPVPSSAKSQLYQGSRDEIKVPIAGTCMVCQ